jgi:hypothetical protein
MVQAATRAPRALHRAAALHHGSQLSAFRALAFKLKCSGRDRHDPPQVCGAGGMNATPFRALEVDFDAVRNRPVLSAPREPCCSTTQESVWSWWTGTGAFERSRILGRYQADVTADVTEYLSHWRRGVDS